MMSGDVLIKKITDGRWFNEAMVAESALNSWKYMEDPGSSLHRE